MKSKKTGIVYPEAPSTLNLSRVKRDAIITKEDLDLVERSNRILQNRHGSRSRLSEDESSIIAGVRKLLKEKTKKIFRQF